MDNFSPINWFINVDFPTFGLPTIFTKPDLCAIIYAKLLAKVRHLNLPLRMSYLYGLAFDKQILFCSNKIRVISQRNYI
jgi:hypothetical protein